MICGVAARFQGTLVVVRMDGPKQGLLATLACVWDSLHIHCRAMSFASLNYDEATDLSSLVHCLLKLFANIGTPGIYSAIVLVLHGVASEGLKPKDFENAAESKIFALVLFKICTS